MGTLKTLMGVLLVGLIACIAWNSVQVQSAHMAPFKPLVSTASSFSTRIVGPPTITAKFIDQVLKRADSPAVGIGPVMYQLGVSYQIDPAFALAFFHHESGYGLHGVARETKSLGNIRCTVGWKCDSTGGYRAYATWTDGVKDWYQLMKDVYLSQGLDTIPEIIPVYAPQADNNNEGSYINTVLLDVEQWRQQARSQEVHI